jgi:hypothetical protein
MPTQYIKTLGALTINDGDPSKPIDIRTGPDPANRGAITINGQSVGGGGGGGGDVFKAGNNNQPGDLQIFTCPITVAPTFDLTANGDFKANADIIASSASTVQILGQLDLADAPGQIAAVISDGGVFEMRAQKGAGQGALKADFSPNTGVYRFGIDAASGGVEGTVQVRGQLEIQDAGNTLIRLNGQGAGANAGLLQATSFQAQGGTYRGTSAGADYVNLGVAGLDTTGVTAGNALAVRDGAIGARTSRHSLTYSSVGAGEVLENIPATGNQKVVTTDTNVPAPGTGSYKLQTQTQTQTIFHMPPINQVVNDYQMTAFTLPDVTITVTDALNAAAATVFSLGTGQTVATSVTTDTSLIPVVPIPGGAGGSYIGGLSLPFGRYRLILRQKAGPNPAQDMDATNTITGLTISEEILYTGFPAVGAAAEYLSVFHTHNTDYDFASWSASGANATFPKKVGTDGRIQLTHQSIAGGHSYFLGFTDWNVATLTGLIANPQITFEIQFITLPMLPV